MTKVERTRNSGKLSDAEYWSKVRGALRKAFARWTPAEQHLKHVRRAYSGQNSRQKFEYPCDVCGDWLPRGEVRSDHKVPVGSLKSLDDLAGFLDRLTPEDHAAFQCVCVPCHQAKTNAERDERTRLRRELFNEKPLGP